MAGSKARFITGVRYNHDKSKRSGVGVRKPRRLRSRIPNAHSLREAFESSDLDPLVWNELSGLLKKDSDSQFKHSSERRLGERLYQLKIEFVDDAWSISVFRYQDRKYHETNSRLFHDFQPAIFEWGFLRYYAPPMKFLSLDRR